MLSTHRFVSRFAMAAQRSQTPSVLLSALQVNHMSTQRGSAGLGLPDELSAKTIEIIKATTPVVGPLATTITKQFYGEMLKNPDILKVFNKANQVAAPGCPMGRQPTALANSICAYATNIDNLGALGGAIDIIAHKHCGLGVVPEQYPFVHSYLMDAIEEVLGKEVFQGDVKAAWSEAVLFLAKVLIDREEQLYSAAETASGGWRGFQPFTIAQIKDVADNMKEFTFSAPHDNGDYTFAPGQFLTLKVDPNGDGLTAPRHYTITSAPDDVLKCTVKRVAGGVVSNYMHDSAVVGDVVHLAPPFGAYVPHETPAPIALVSAGCGVTPMLNFGRYFGDQVKLIVHADGTRPAHAYHNIFEEYNCDKVFRYNDENNNTHPNLEEMAKNAVDNIGTAADFYVCGPPEFTQGLETSLKSLGVTNVYSELFGPELSK
eukprot:m.179281 g.179281  ORF g.179281 m.179281 type:complete len:431 (+) comp31967_c0_seq1:183-1475(+)